MLRTKLPALVLVAVCTAGVVSCGGDESGSPAAGGDAAQRGAQLAKDRGCQACHKVEGNGIGPTWVGLYGSTVTLEDGSTVVADETYLHEAIADPSARRVAGYDVAMPDNSLTADEIDDVIAYIRSLVPSADGTTP
jgi:cytochrome c oxidase subunit II